jgi:hypothetical protein
LINLKFVFYDKSNNSLFAIPPNQEFVYIHRLKAPKFTNQFLLSNLYKECFKYKDPILSTSLNLLSSLNHANSFSPSSYIREEENDSRLFKKFVYEHIKTAFKEGFNDNIGRTNVNPVFEIPKAGTWFKLFISLVDFFLKEPKSSKMKSNYEQLKALIDIDAQFSENRCKKVLPAALGLYEEGLPPHYTRSQHQQRLDKAVRHYSLQARGPMFSMYMQQLIDECLCIWRNGRQLCEAISLTGNPCVYELHTVPSKNQTVSDEQLETDNKIEERIETKEFSNEDPSITSDRSRSHKILHRNRGGVVGGGSQVKKSNFFKTEHSERNSSTNSSHSRDTKNLQNKTNVAQVKCHSSNIVTRAASNCGEFQLERHDPFDLKEANYDFYAEFSNFVSASKKTLIIYEFDVFKPGSINVKPAVKAPSTIVDNIHSRSLSDNSSAINLSQPSERENEQQQHSILSSKSPSKEHKQRLKNSQQQPSQANEEKLLSSNVINQNSSTSPQNIQHLDTSIINLLVATSAASTELYLPAMTHSESIPGLLPLFSSWSLVSIGKSSDYNPQAGEAA